MMTKAEQFVKYFNENFSPPFLPEGVANAAIFAGDPNYVIITIGKREMQINLGEGHFFLGSGTTVAKELLKEVSIETLKSGRAKDEALAAIRNPA